MQVAPLPHSPSASGSNALETFDAPHPAAGSSEPCSRENLESDAATTCFESTNDNSEILALPAPNEIQKEGDSAMQLTLGQRVSLEEELGPLVVNPDGTVARISNWKQMTERERSNVLRVLGKRNKERLDVLKEQTAQQQ